MTVFRKNPMVISAFHCESISCTYHRLTQVGIGKLKHSFLVHPQALREVPLPRLPAWFLPLCQHFVFLATSRGPVMGYPLCQESLPALRERDRVREIWTISMHVRSICTAICDTVMGVYRYHGRKVRAHFISLTPWNSMLGTMYASCRRCCISDCVSVG